MKRKNSKKVLKKSKSVKFYRNLLIASFNESEDKHLISKIVSKSSTQTLIWHILCCLDSGLDESIGPGRRNRHNGQQAFSTEVKIKRKCKMARKNIRKTKHKAPKFRDANDETLDWQDRLEIRHLRRKQNKRSYTRRDELEKW